MQDLIDSISIEEIEIKYESYLETLEERHNRNISAFENMGGIAGAMGMIGTLIGLVAMLLKMDDPAAIGPAMAVALLTTLYGALVGNLFAGIMETKLKAKHDLEVAFMETTTQAAVLLINDDSIGNIKMKLNSFLQEAPQ